MVIPRLKILLIAGWALTGLALLVAVQSEPASGYEHSIYAALPGLFWVLFLGSLSIQILASVYMIFVLDQARARLSLFAVAGVFTNLATLTLLPDIRGYLFHGIGDMPTYVSGISQIASSGHFDRQNFYPIASVLASMLHLVSGVEIRKVVMITPPLWYAVYVLGVFLTGQAIAPGERFAPLAALAASLPVAGFYALGVYPAAVSMALVPMLFYSYFAFGHRGPAFKVPLVLLLVLSPLLHPFTSLVLMVSFAFIEAAKILVARSPLAGVASALRGGVNPGSAIHERRSVNPLFILLVVFLTWFSSFAIWNRSIDLAFRAIRGEAESTTEVVTYFAEKAHFGWLDTIQYAAKVQGGTAAYVLIAVASLVGLWSTQRGRAYLLSGGNRILLLLFALAGMGLVAVINLAAIISDIYRPLRYMVVPATVLIGSAVLTWRSAKTAWSRLGTLLVLVALGGALNYYASPYNFQPNQQTAAGDLAATYWLASRTTGPLPVKVLISPVHRYMDYLVGKQERGARLVKVGMQLPDHFGYHEKNLIASNYEESVYVLVSKLDRDTYLGVWKCAERFDPEDFARLDSDPSANLVYSSGESRVWKTRVLSE